jgi:hypothetical protein
VEPGREHEHDPERDTKHEDATAASFGDRISDRAGLPYVDS